MFSEVTTGFVSDTSCIRYGHTLQPIAQAAGKWRWLYTLAYASARHWHGTHRRIAYFCHITWRQGLLAVEDSSGTAKLIATPHCRLMAANGQPVMLAKLHIGMQVWGGEGLVKIAKLTQLPPHSATTVWQVRPQSSSLAANIVWINGFWVGSLRLDLDWARAPIQVVADD